MDAPKTGFNELLGIHFCGGEKGQYQLELTVGPKHCHQAGLVHCGVYLSLLAKESANFSLLKKVDEMFQL